MAINQCFENFLRFELLMPTAVAINSGDLLIFGKGTKAMVGIAQTSQAASLTSGTPYNDNTGYITIQTSGAANLLVHGNVSSIRLRLESAINRGDPVFADGGIFDPVSGITRGSTLDADANGTFIGIAMDPVPAGAQTTIRVILKNALGS